MMTHINETSTVEEPTTQKDIDSVILQAVEAGIESGKSIGVLEAYNLLVREGYGVAAEVMLQLIEDNPTRIEA